MQILYYSVNTHYKYLFVIFLFVLNLEEMPENGSVSRFSVDPKTIFVFLFQEMEQNNENQRKIRNSA